MVNRYLLYLLFFSIYSCAPVISPELRAKIDPSLNLRKVLENPNAYKGKMVLWGGEIIRFAPQDGTVFIEVLQKPIGWRGKPRILSASEGKFLILVKEYLDLSLLKKEKKITVAGEIQDALQGNGIKNLSDKGYRYPLILSRQIHLWKEYFSPYSSLPPPRDPFEYNPPERQLRF